MKIVVTVEAGDFVGRDDVAAILDAVERYVVERVGGSLIGLDVELREFG